MGRVKPLSEIAAIVERVARGPSCFKAMFTREVTFTTCSACELPTCDEKSPRCGLRIRSNARSRARYRDNPEARAKAISCNRVAGMSAERIEKQRVRSRQHYLLHRVEISKQRRAAYLAKCEKTRKERAAALASS